MDLLVQFVFKQLQVEVPLVALLATARVHLDPVQLLYQVFVLYVEDLLYPVHLILEIEVLVVDVLQVAL